VTGLLARAGEKVTCENNHPICTVAADLRQGEIVRRASFKDWTWDYEPVSGQSTPNCPVCGSVVFPVIGDDGACLYIDGNTRGRGSYLDD
jgi:hypothetical protein